MNWKRVAVYTLILMAATAAAGFPFGFVQGFMSSQGNAPPSWLPLAQLVVSVGAAACVFFALARREAQRPYEHGFAVLAAGMLVTLPINVGLLGQTLVTSVAGAVWMVLALVLGVAFAKRFAARPIR